MSLLTHERWGSVRPATLAALVAILSILGCGQKAPSSAEGAKTAAPDTAVQVQPTGDAPAVRPSSDPVTSAPETPGKAETPAVSPGQAQKLTGPAALAKAAAAGKYLLVLFYRNDDDEAQAMKKIIASAAAKLKANSITINVADAAEKDIVAKYQVDRAPMPLALVVAPTGAVTGGFPGKVTEEQLSGAFVSPGLANSLKALQDGKLVLLCVQNASTKSNDAAMRGVNAFMTYSRFTKSTEVVVVDPTDGQELKFLTQVQIDPKTSEAVTALLAPPGSVVAQYKGATSKDVMIAALAAKQAGGGGG